MKNALTIGKIILGLAAIFLIIWLVTQAKSCNVPPAPVVKLDTTLKAKWKSDSIKMANVIGMFGRELDQAQKVNDTLSRKLQVSTATGHTLATRLQNQQSHNIPDTGKFIKDCDSLASTTLNQGFIINQYREALAQYYTKQDSLNIANINTRNSMANDYATLNAAYVAAVNAANGAIKNSLWVGANAMGSATKPFSGYGFELLFATKKGFGYRVSAIQMGVTTYYQASLLKKISFK